MILDTQIATSLSRPHRNIHGDVGDRCPMCSGLGKTLVLGGDHRRDDGLIPCLCRACVTAKRQFHPTTLAPTLCVCKGTGLAAVSAEFLRPDQLLKEINKIESVLGLPLTSIFRLNGKMSRQYWMECIAWATVPGTSVNTTAAETIIFPNVTIPANYMADGRLLRLELTGEHSTLGSGTVTTVFRSRWGGLAGTLLCGTGTITQVISLSHALWTIWIDIQTRSNGATGTLFAGGEAVMHSGTAPTIASATGAAAVAAMTAGGQTTPAAVTVDLTTDTALSITGQMGASSASNILLGHQYSILSKN